MTWFFFTNRYKYNAAQIFYINYIHLISLEAGIFLIFRQFIVYTETPRRDHQLPAPRCCPPLSTIRSLSCAVTLSLSKNSGRKNQTLLKIFLGLFCPYSGDNQGCLLWYSPNSAFPQWISPLTPPLKKCVSGMEMKSSGSPFPLHIHHPVSAGLINTSPEVCLEVKVDLGCTLRFRLSTLPCGLVQK